MDKGILNCAKSGAKYKNDNVREKKCEDHIVKDDCTNPCKWDDQKKECSTQAKKKEQKQAQQKKCAEKKQGDCKAPSCEWDGSKCNDKAKKKCVEKANYCADAKELKTCDKNDKYKVNCKWDGKKCKKIDDVCKKLTEQAKCTKGCEWK